MKKVSIFIDSDIIFRNFILSINGFKEVESKFLVNYIFPEEGNKRFKTNPKHFINSEKILRIKEDPIRKKYWRYLLYLSVIKPSLDKRLSILRKFRIYTLGKKAAFIFTVLSLPIIRQFITLIIKRFLIKTKYIDLENYFKIFQPDIVIHPTVLDGIYCNDLTLLSKKFNYKTIFIINSWDNPSSKNVLVNPPDTLLVWGEQTRTDAKNYMNIADDSIIKFGANQFEGLKNIKRTSLNVKNHNIIKSKVLFAGSNIDVDEFTCLKNLNHSISKKNSSIQILYRPHPWASSTKENIEKIKITKLKNISIDKSLDKYYKDLDNPKTLFSLPDQKHAYKALVENNITISPLSTLIIETIISGRVAIAYVPNESENKYIKDVFIKHFHFQDMINNIIVCKNHIEILENIEKLQDLKVYKINLDKQQNLIKNYVSDFNDSWSNRLAKLIS
jgi:hypothetical protein